MSASPLHVLIFGASARAAAGSALRAGFRPWCVDLFADTDLCRLCPARKLTGRYPAGFLEFIDVDLLGPWMYTGGLENRPTLVEQMARRRPLWGNGRAALRIVRDSEKVAQIVRAAGLPAPELRELGGQVDSTQRWLLKPRMGAGGIGIRFWQAEPACGSVRNTSPKRKRGRGVRSTPLLARRASVQPNDARSIERSQQRYYLQQFIDGVSWSAVFAGDGNKARLLGVTRQLVGERWLHAGAFQYCGSIGPVAPEPILVQRFERLGDALASHANLRGLFGVDGVVRDGIFWPVEVNPRYPASVEVLEHATGLKALAWHQQAFDPQVPSPALPGLSTVIVGKAILFARQSLSFPHAGPWQERSALSHVEATPDFADVPTPGEQIESGGPVLTFFARAASIAACEQDLRLTALDLDRWLYGG